MTLCGAAHCFPLVLAIWCISRTNSMDLTSPLHLYHWFPNNIGSEKVNKKGVSDQIWWWVGGRGHKVDCWHSLGQEIRHPSHIFTLSSIPDYYLRVFFPMKTIFLLLCHAKWAAVEMLSKVIFSGKEQQMNIKRNSSRLSTSPIH